VVQSLAIETIAVLALLSWTALACHPSRLLAPATGRRPSSADQGSPAAR